MHAGVRSGQRFRGGVYKTESVRRKFVCVLAVNVDIDIEGFMGDSKVVVALFDESRFRQRFCSAIGHLVSRFDPSERYSFFVDALPYPMYFRAPVFDCRRAASVEHCANNCLVVFLHHCGTAVRKPEVTFEPTQLENITHAVIRC